MAQEIMAQAFVIRPFDKKKDSSGKEIDFELIHKELIDPSLEEANLKGRTTGKIIDSGNIREDMFSLILEADLVICDVTIHNANVFYELGLRHALRKRGAVLIKGNPSADNIPFDLLTDRYLPYNLDDPASARQQLTEMIVATLRSDRETDSPVFKMLPALPEANANSIQVVPMDFSEEVDRARAANSKGWLRLLAKEVKGLRFQWAGLRLVAQAQWSLKDYAGARASFEEIHDVNRGDVDSILALANIYERLYREEKKAQLLTLSEQVIGRVITSDVALPRHRVEALALRGRNHKTRWRDEFESLATVPERRQAGSNRLLRESYEAYRGAFFQDLNHFYSGLAALQLGAIFLDLSPKDSDLWKVAFDNDAQAESYRRKVSQEVKALSALVPASIEAKQGQMKPDDPERLWAQISLADLLFLTEQNESRVIKRYQDVIPANQPFAWDAAKGQLQLFEKLGVKGELAQKVIAAVDSAFEGDSREGAAPNHVLLFAGHCFDAPGRAEDRFPSKLAGRAKTLIIEALNGLNQDCKLLGLASAAPGADLLFHEACSELNIHSIICLPMPVDAYVRANFETLDELRSRFFRFTEGNKQILELSDQDGLPRWFGESVANSWERGNQWVLQMALASGAQKITLLALWDGKNEGDGPGGTAHMVNLARNSGKIHVNIIDSRKLSG
jgi:Tetratricopeptide Repeats-Sensor